MNRILAVSFCLGLFTSCASEIPPEVDSFRIAVESEITVDVMEELSVIDYLPQQDLYLGYAGATEEIILFNSKGEVKHQWEPAEAGSPEDYGRIYGLSFFDDESLLVISLFRGVHRIDFSGQIIENIELPFQPAITGYQVQRKATRINESYYVIDLPGRVNPFDQIENKYSAPLYELWNLENGTFEPVVLIAEESKYRQYNVINFPTFTFSEGKLYHVNDNEPVVYVYSFEDNTFVFERSITLSPPVFYEPRESLLNEDDEFYEAENYLMEVYEGRLYVFYSAGIAPDVFEQNMVDEDYERLFAEHEQKWVAAVDLATGRIQYNQLPEGLDHVQTIGANGLFLARKNLYFSDDESDTNRFHLLRLQP